MGPIGGICFLLFYFIYAKYFEKEHKNSKLNNIYDYTMKIVLFAIWFFVLFCFIFGLICFLVSLLHLRFMFGFCSSSFAFCILVKHFTIVMHNLSWLSFCFLLFIFFSFFCVFCVCFPIISFAFCFAAFGQIYLFIYLLKISINCDGFGGRQGRPAQRTMHVPI